MFHKPRNTFHNNAKQTKFKKASVDQTTVDKVSEMPELADVVPELVCLGIDVAICGVISQGPHFHKTAQSFLSNLNHMHQNPLMVILARLCTPH